MGCDIHMYLERKRHIINEDKWVNIDYWQHNPYYSSQTSEYEKTMECIPVYDGRNYSLFSVLADVRNYEGVKFISKPKGMPDDMDSVTKSEYEYWRCDSHSASYLTLKELIDFNCEEELKYIIEPIKERVKKEFWIYTDDEEEVQNQIYKESENVRIVFWFDN